MQKAYALFNALGAIVGNFALISGCETVGGSVTNGVVFIDGELLEFRGGVIQDYVIIVETPTSLEFEDTNSHDVIFTRYATFGSATTQWPWTDFKRGFPTIDIADALAGKATTMAVNELVSTIGTMLEKLNTIDANAKIQVRTDWNATIGVAVIDNKPDISNPFLYKGVFSIGDVTGADNVRTVNFPTVGTANYFVIGSLRGKSSDYNTDDDVFWSYREESDTSFKLCLREISNNTQDLEFFYVLIAK
ncbi:hypothetical protein [Flavobacterium sp. UBA6046]|uniref:hypothetical protein n=1 Tax=Flavobacterium sp. UBA6046 TaxID=1946552 RepID=UPI0025B8757A|nr:hypothetical protein [Flavobacterium sp. UBA6046]